MYRRPVAAIDYFLPNWDFRERHERRVEGDPERALAALLATPVAPSSFVRALLRARGLRADGTIESFASRGFEVLARTPTELVLGLAGTPWRPRGGRVPFSEAAGTVRIVTDFRAEPGLLSTETRVAAADEQARRRFRPYWLVVRPFSGLIRRSWLRAAAQAAGSAQI